MKKHQFFCEPVGTQKTGVRIITKLNVFFRAEKLEWNHCVVVTTDAAVAMAGKHKGLIAYIKKESSLSVSSLNVTKKWHLKNKNNVLFSGVVRIVKKIEQSIKKVVSLLISAKSI